MKTLPHAPAPVHVDPYATGADFDLEWPLRSGDTLDVDETFGLIADGPYDDEAPELPISAGFDPDEADEDWAALHLNDDAPSPADDAMADALAAMSAALDRMERGLDGCDHGGSLVGHAA